MLSVAIYLFSCWMSKWRVILVFQHLFSFFLFQDKSQQEVLLRRRHAQDGGNQPGRRGRPGREGRPGRARRARQPEEQRSLKQSSFSFLRFILVSMFYQTSSSLKFRQNELGFFSLESILKWVCRKVILIRLGIYVFVNKARGGGSPKFFINTLWCHNYMKLKFVYLWCHNYIIRNTNYKQPK